MCAKSFWSCPTLCDPMDCSPPGFSVFSPGKITRVGCSALLRGISPTQGSNPPFLGLWRWQADSLPLADYIRQAPYNSTTLISIRSFSEVLDGDIFVDHHTVGFPGGSVVMNPPANVAETGWIPGSGRSPGEGNGNAVQYSWLGNFMDRAWQGTGHEVTEESDMIYLLKNNNNLV